MQKFDISYSHNEM